MNRLSMSLFVVAVALSPAAATAEPLRSTKAMEALNPAAADHLVRHDLLSILRPVQRRLSSGMLVQLRLVDLGTRPYGTAYARLCQRDELWLKYASADPAPAPRDQPMQPYGFESHAFFHVLGSPAPIAADGGVQDNVWNHDCDTLADRDDLQWFKASDADEAAQAVAFLQLATSLIRSGTLKPPFCDQRPNDRRSCEQMILEDAALSKIGDVSACGGRASAIRCYEISVDGGLVLTIVGRVDGDHLTPKAIESITIRHELIVT